MKNKNNLSLIKSLAIFKNSGILLKIYFFKKNGNGKIYFSNILKKNFFYSLKKILYFIKSNFSNIYNIIKLNNIYIKIYPKKFILTGSSISLALFLNFFCLVKNIKLIKNLIILGDIDQKGNIININSISKKINCLDKKKYIIIIPENNYINYNYILKCKKYNLFFLKINNIFNLIKLLKIS